MEIRIGKHILGVGRPAFIVAEMSGNHGGSLERALEIVRAAKRAGADAIKLQTYTADTITLNCDRDDFRLPAGTPWAEYATLWDLYDKAHTPWDWHEAIFAEARRLDLEVFSSPFDESAVDLLEGLEAPAYKIASPEITHIPLLERVAQTRKPVIISTGIAELADIELALETLRGAGASEIIVLKCTTAYPAPPEDSNLSTIADMAARFGVLAGLSDHTLGSVAPICAVALGASFIEKHFVLDEGKDTVDSFFSSGEAEFSRMVQDIRLAEKSLGRVSYEIAPSARSNLRGRRSLYVVEAIKAGEVFSDANVKSIRPSFGLHPKYKKTILGRHAKRDLQPGDRLSWEAVE
ncbi:pseudaminic acid synthase [Thiobacillus sp.]|uniref:pseudaminic acid synthase n=1 Tax=Thiobacillus sp. TaxID=924 RepID=UPI0011D8C91C|nr:pseudaminic acid synthase [Thiobacillus sp.]TXH76320.1 MAG: pseudaminic acid synthase [Thiobacillus sp.]